MKTLSNLLWTAAAAAAMAQGAAPALAADLSKLPPPSDKTGLTFAKDIRPLFEASCTSCHGERRQRAGLRVDTLEGVLAGGDEGKVLIPGNSKESSLVHAVAQIDDETAMPPRRQRGGFGGGPGGGAGAGGGGGRGDRPGGAGPGRGGGGGLTGMLAGGLFSQADGNGDKKLTSAEFTKLAETWFDGMDTAKAGKLSEAEISERLDRVLPPLQVGGGAGGGGRGAGGQRGGNEGMGFGPGRFLGGGLFTATDTDKDNSVTRAEFLATFAKWHAGWDAAKAGSIGEDQFRDGLAAAWPRGTGGGGGRGPGGFGGFGIFGRQALAEQMVTQGDTDKNQKLSSQEFVALSGTWWSQLDPEKTGKVSGEQFAVRLSAALGLPPTEAPAPAANPARPGGDPARPERPGTREGGPGGGPGGGRGMGGPAGLAPGLLAAMDADKDGSLTAAEIQTTFKKWSAEFDTAKAGALSSEELYAGLREALPQGALGGFGGFAGGGGQGGAGGRGPGGGRGFGGDQGAPAKPLTAAEVGLVRAWIDQGAK